MKRDSCRRQNDVGQPLWSPQLPADVMDDEKEENVSADDLPIRSGARLPKRGDHKGRPYDGQVGGRRLCTLAQTLRLWSMLSSFRLAEVMYYSASRSY